MTKNIQQPNASRRPFGSPEFFLVSAVASLLIGYFLNWHGMPGIAVGAFFCFAGIGVSILRWRTLTRLSKLAAIGLASVAVAAALLLCPYL